MLLLIFVYNILKIDNNSRIETVNAVFEKSNLKLNVRIYIKKLKVSISFLILKTKNMRLKETGWH